MNPTDLLRHADSLLAPSVGKPGAVPTEVDLRRAVSAAYYAVFHILTAAGAKIVASGNAALQTQIARAFNHTAMRKVCDTYVRAPAKPFPLLPHLNPTQPDPRLSGVASAFAELQDARHLADYDLSFISNFSGTARLVKMADAALTDFAAIQSDPDTQVFLTALLLSDKWTRRG